MQSRRVGLLTAPSQAAESNEAFERILSRNEEVLECKSDITKMLKEIHGL